VAVTSEARVKFHYFLVDDLFTREEFERRVEKKVAESGDLFDDHTAAMLVVREAGRTHVKIRDLKSSSSLVCFFGKVLSINEPREFTRADGEAGIVSSITVGDETGQARVVLWDEKAQGVHEIEVGDVLEILGRPKGTAMPEVHAAALQKAACDISCEAGTPAPGRQAEASPDLLVRLVAVDAPRTYTRRDGSVGQMVDAVIGDEQGVARLVCWAPRLLEIVSPGSSVLISGAVKKTGDQGIEYSLGETGAVQPSDANITVPLSPIGALQEGGTHSVTGTIRSLQDPRAFTTRTGKASTVRNLIIADDTGEVRLVLWGEKAEEHLVAGDRVEVYNAAARRNRYGDLELSLSWGSALVVLHPGTEEEIVFSGTIIARPAGLSIDDGTVWYLIDEELPIGLEIRVFGTVRRGIIAVREWEPVSVDPAALRERTNNLL